MVDVAILFVKDGSNHTSSPHVLLQYDLAIPHWEAELIPLTQKLGPSYDLLVTNRMWWSKAGCLLKWGQIRPYSFHLVLLGHLLWGKPATMEEVWPLWGHTLKRPHVGALVDSPSRAQLLSHPLEDTRHCKKDIWDPPEQPLCQLSNTQWPQSISWKAELPSWALTKSPTHKL